MAESIQQRVYFNGPGLVRLVSDQALLGLLSDSLLECEPWVPRCLAETIHRMWLFRGQNGAGFDHSDQFHEAWQQCGISEELGSALTKWCAQQQSKRSFDLPELSGGDDRLRQTWELLTRLLQHWKDSDGMVVFARESDDESIRSAIVVPFVFGSRDDDEGIFGLFGDVEGLDLMDALKRATWIASSKKWIANNWRPAVRFPSLDAPIDATPLVGMSASLPFLAALRARSKGRRFHTLRFGFSGVLDPNGRLEAINTPSLWAAKRAVLTQLGARCILPGDWPVNEPVQDALNDLMAQVWDECVLAECIKVPKRAEPKKHDFQPYLEEKTPGFFGRDSFISKLKASDKHTLVVAPQGTGKSSLMAKLVQNRMRKEIIAHYFCRADIPVTRNPMTFVQSLAAMLAERLPEYDDQMTDETVMNALSGTDAAGALSQGIIAPLRRIKAPPDNGVRYVTIDALDEASVDEENQISELLARQFHQLPEWIKVIATTRDDPRVIKHNLKTWQRINLNDDDNREDVRCYVTQRLRGEKLARLVVESRVADAWLSAELGKKCEGNFLYAKLVLQALEGGHYQLDQLGRLPPGLEGYYDDTFKRIFPEGFSHDMRTILEVMLCARDPLRRKELAEVTGIKPAALHNELVKIQPLLDKTWQESNGVIRFVHESLARWLNADLSREQSEAMAPDMYQVSGAEGHKRLADWCAKSGGDAANLSDYQRRHGTYHMVESCRWNAATDRLTNLHYIKDKAGAGEVYDLIDEYQHTLKRIRPAKQDEYQVTRIQGFLRFVIMERFALSEFGHRKGFVVQQALNHTAVGPVTEAAKQALIEIKSPLLIRRWSNIELIGSPSHNIVFPVTDSILDCVVDSHWKQAATLHCNNEDSQFVCIWDMETGALIHEFSTGNEIVMICFQSHEYRLIGVDFHLHQAVRPAVSRLSVWDATSGCLKREIECPPSLLATRIDAMGATPDGKQIIVCSLVAEKTGAERKWPNSHWAAFIRWDIDHCSSLVLNTIEMGWELDGHSANMQIANDGQIAVLQQCIVDLADGNVHELEPGNWPILTADGKRLFIGLCETNTVLHWDIDGHKVLQRCALKECEGIQRIIAVFAGDNKRLALIKDAFSLGIWDLHNGDRLCSLHGGEYLRKAYFRSDGKTLLFWSGESDLSIRYLMTEDGEWTEAPTGSDSLVTSGVSMDGKIAFSGQRTIPMSQQSSRGWIVVWDVETASGKRRQVNVDAIIGGCLSRDGKSFVLASWCPSEDSIHDQDYQLSRWKLAIEGEFSEQGKLDLATATVTASTELEWNALEIPHRYFDSMMDLNKVRSLAPCDTSRLEDPTSFVIDISRKEQPCRREIWTVSWQGKRVPFWGGGGFRRLVTNGVPPKHTQGIDSADGEWVITWHAKELVIKNRQGKEPDITMVFPRPIERVSIDNNLKVLAIESPPGELTFFNTNRQLRIGPLVANLHRHIFGEDKAPSAPFALSPCCAKAFTPEPELIDKVTELSLFHQTLDSFDDLGLLANCPHCKTRLKFNPFFIDIRRFSHVEKPD